jgi:anti-anti-sigma regulatory factor
MEIQTEFADDVSVLILSGAANPAVARHLHEAALRAAIRELPIVLQCAELERLDASCLQVLIALRTALQASGKTLSILGMTEKVEGNVRRAGAGFLLAEASGSASGEY